MIMIAHRGNINGPEAVDVENTLSHITAALAEGFDVEVDIWYVDRKWWSGHDSPMWPFPQYLLHDNRVWCHAKNIDALYHLLRTGVHCFFHDQDDVALTSRGYLWTYPGKQTTDKSIVVITDDSRPPENCYGACSDYVAKYRTLCEKT